LERAEAARWSQGGTTRDQPTRGGRPRKKKTRKWSLGEMMPKRNRSKSRGTKPLKAETNC